MVKKYFLVAVLMFSFMFICSEASAQLRYKVDFRTIMDNTEGSRPYALDRTISGVLLVPHLGFSMGNHSLVVGVGMLELFGTKKTVDNVDLRAYYEYNDSKFKAIAGIYSKDEREGYPLSFYTTSRKFLDNKAQGIYGHYRGENGYVEAWVDWFKSDIEERVDRFAVSVNGHRWWEGFRVQGIFLYEHYADRPVFQDFMLFDHLQFDFNAGYDFARHQNVFDKIMITAGLSGDSARARNDAAKGFEWGLGFQSDQYLEWNGFLLHNTFYVGQPQMKYYKEYPFIYSGSPFYQSKWHDTMCLKYTYNYKWLSLSANFVFFFTPETVATQQLLTVSFNIDDVIMFGKKSK